MLEKFKNVKGKKQNKLNELKDNTVVLNQDITMTFNEELNHEGIFKKLALEIDFMTIGKWVNRIPEERVKFINAFQKALGIEL